MSTGVADRQRRVGRVLHGRLPRTLLVLAALVGVWQWVSRAEVLDPFLFPPPTTVLSDTIDALFEPPSPALGSEGLLFHVQASLRRAALGWLLGGAVGILFGLVVQWWSGIVSETGNAMLELLRPIPIILMLPMLVVIIGIGDTPRVLVIAASVFVVVAINTMYGVRSARGSLLNDVARSFGAGPIMTLYVAGILSANLAVVNILPFPPLDGGRMLMITLKKVFGTRISVRAEQMTYLVGFVFLFAFIIWVTGFDLARAFGGVAPVTP